MQVGVRSHGAGNVPVRPAAVVCSSKLHVREARCIQLGAQELDVRGVEGLLVPPRTLVRQADVVARAHAIEPGDDVLANVGQGKERASLAHIFLADKARGRPLQRRRGDARRARRGLGHHPAFVPTSARAAVPAVVPMRNLRPARGVRVCRNLDLGRLKGRAVLRLPEEVEDC